MSEPDWQSGQYLSERDWEYLRTLRALLLSAPTAAQVASFVEAFAAGPRNGLIVDVASDVAGLFDLDRSAETRLVLDPGLDGHEPSELVRLLVGRIDAIVPGRFVLPKQLFRREVTAIEVDGALVAVRSVADRPWDYVIFATVAEPVQHYVEILYGSTALFTKVSRLDPADGGALGSLDAEGRDRLVDRYR